MKRGQGDERFQHPHGVETGHHVLDILEETVEDFGAGKILRMQTAIGGGGQHRQVLLHGRGLHQALEHLPLEHQPPIHFRLDGIEAVQDIHPDLLLVEALAVESGTQHQRRQRQDDGGGNPDKNVGLETHGLFSVSSPAETRLNIHYG